MSYKITVIPGDGIGKEITDSAVEVLKKVDEKFGLGLSYTYKDAGGSASMPTCAQSRWPMRSSSTLR